jgi:hypothetical protein
MSTSAQRQRKRRERLRQQGYIDVTVAVQKVHAKALRQFAKGLSAGSTAPTQSGRLLEVIRILKSIRPHLNKAGIKHAGVFGSAARCDDSPQSDIDILVDIDAKQVGDALTYIDITDAIKKSINTRYPDVDVDVADHATLKPAIRKRAEVDAIYAF